HTLIHSVSILPVLCVSIQPYVLVLFISLFSLMPPPPPSSTPFPYTTLFRSWRTTDGKFPIDASGALPDGRSFHGPDEMKAILKGDRKSTRLNSSHGSISYAVFCLKKKKKNRKNEHTST